MGRDESGKSRDESAAGWDESAARACQEVRPRVAACRGIERVFTPVSSRVLAVGVNAG